MTVRIRVNGTDATITAIREMRERLENLEPAMRAIGERMNAFVDDRFRAEKDPTGSPWPDLSEATKGKRRGTDHKILSDTTRMRNSKHYTAGPQQVRWGMSAVYAGVHHFGNPKNNLPNTRGPFTYRTKTGKTVTQKPRRAPIPARPFAPVERSGGGRRGDLRMVEQGDAVDFWARVISILRNYIETGEPRVRS